MSSQTSYKWKFKKDRKKSKPYERPSNENWLSRVASTIKESIPNWIPYWPFATSYDQNHDRDELTEIETEAEVENVKDNVIVINNRTNETPFELKRPGIMAEQKLDDDPLVNKLINTNAKNRKSDAKLDPVPGLTLHPIASTSKVTSQCPGDEDGSSSTENTASSTSGCSSLVPSNQYHLQRLGIPFLKEVKDLEKKRKEIMKKTRDVGVETDVKNLSRSGCKRSFLWTDPSINIMNSSRLVNNLAYGSIRANKSPFYEGKTSFGGTSAKRPRFSAPYYKPQTSALNTGAKVNGSKMMDHSDILSDAAKKILANIEKISSPIEDAKRMPVLGSFDPTKYTLEHNRPFRRGKMPNFTLPESTSPSSLNLQVSNPQLKWPSPEESVKISTNSEKKEIASQNTSAFVGKMRTRISKPNVDQISLKSRKDEITSDTNYLNEVVSPKMKNLPSFNFSNNVKQLSQGLPSNVGKSKSRVSTTTTTVVEVNKKQSGEDENEFFFSPPLQASDPSTIKQPASEIKSIDLCTINQNTNQKKVKSQSNKDTVPKGPIKSNVNLIIPQKVSKDALLEEDKNDKDLSKNSAEDKTNKFQQSDSVKASAGSWTCSTCLIFNPIDKNICMACDALKPGAIKNSRSPSLETNYGNESNEKNEDVNTSVKPSNQWTCTTCLIVNSSEKSACMACEASKPGLMKNPKASFKFNIIDMDSKDVNKSLKPQSDNWTCNTCFVPNPEEKVACVACEIPKTGAPKAIPTISSGIKFGFDKVEKDKEVISNIRSEQLDSSDNRFKQPSVSSMSSESATNKEFDKAKPDHDEPKIDNKNEMQSSGASIFKVDDFSNKGLSKASSTNDNSTSKSEMRSGVSQPITTQIEISTEKPSESNKIADKEKIKIEKPNPPAFTFGGSVIDSKSSEKVLTSSSISIFSSKKDSKEESKMANVSASSDASSSSLMNIEPLDDKPRETSIKIMKDGDNSFTNTAKFPEKSSPWPEGFTGFGKEIEKSKIQTSGFSSNSNSGFKFDANANKTSGLGSNSSTTPSFTSLSQPATYDFSLKLPLNQAASTVQSNPPSFFGSTPLSSSSTPALPIPSTGSTAVSTSESKDSSIGFEPRPAESTFKFGSSGKPSLQKGTFSSPSFSDLRSSTVMKPGAGVIPDSTSKSFTFGNKITFPTPTTSETPTVSSTSASPLFSFSSNISTIPKSPVFGFGSNPPTSQIMPSGFSFDPKTTSNCADTIGSVTSNLAPAPATSSSIIGSVQNPPVFSFGNPTGNSTPAFQFGSSTTNTASSNNTFIFGSQNSTSNLVTHGLQSSGLKPFENPFAKPSGDFTFGNTSSSTSQAPSAPSGLFSSANQNSGISSTPGTLNFSTSPSFNFAESSAQSGTLFQFTANNPGSPMPPTDHMRRNIKKARRRLGQS